MDAPVKKGWITVLPALAEDHCELSCLYRMGDFLAAKIFTQADLRRSRGVRGEIPFKQASNGWPRRGVTLPPSACRNRYHSAVLTTQYDIIVSAFSERRLQVASITDLPLGESR